MEHPLRPISGLKAVAPAQSHESSICSHKPECMGLQYNFVVYSIGIPSLEHPVQRKLAAILAADVVGYSHLMEMDEAATLRRLKSTREQLIDPKIAASGGRVVKLMGDGMLVEFPSV